MPFVVVSNAPMGSGAFRAPEKTICNPEPDGPSGPGTTKLVQKTAEASKPVPGSLSYPLDAAVAVVGRLSWLGNGRGLPSSKTVGSGLEQTCQKRILDAFPVGPDVPSADRRAPRDAPDPRWVL